jgi:surface polysaccharide O-acyltransferase-like enzyme
MPTAVRRHDVDWLRTIALGLLIVFHIILVFMPWSATTGYPYNGEDLNSLIPFVSMLTVWRIPLLFLISGMGVRFAMERRDWKALLKDRTLRIVLPFLFGTYLLGSALSFAVPATGWDAEYIPNFGHLWFLANIFLYVVWLLGLMVYLKDNPGNAFLKFLRRLLGKPWGIYVFALPVMVEALLVNPEFFSIYIDNLHGWLIGLVCFFTGFLFISVQAEFWPAVTRVRWISLLLAGGLFGNRWFVFEFQEVLPWLTGLESMCWMLALLGFGARFLNMPSRALTYLSGAVYPVYIVHLPIQFVLCYFVLPLSMSPWAKLGILLVGTFGVSLAMYEFVLKRIRWVRPFFGMKMKIPQLQE